MKGVRPAHTATLRLIAMLTIHDIFCVLLLRNCTAGQPIPKTGYKPILNSLISGSGMVYMTPMCSLDMQGLLFAVRVRMALPFAGRGVGVPKSGAA